MLGKTTQQFYDSIKQAIQDGQSLNSAILSEIEDANDESMVTMAVENNLSVYESTVTYWIKEHSGDRLYPILCGFFHGLLITEERYDVNSNKSHDLAHKVDTSFANGPSR